MRGFEWEALRIGDAVSVHDTSDRFLLRSGIVTSVFGRFHKRTVGVTLDGATAPDAPPEVWWPTRLQAHLEPRVGSEPCWRCEWKQVPR